ncbi:hypothetical protein [Bradyrhizobium sp. 76]|uniref:hypothetical protein n=1 Tax=Bradyrhizobium sp. 76 TaxID=2782680 RepID=UPI001FF909F2|nr:hypothetical protein [Bradyrhizobium sp. 76]MCK1407657.1 hypothetical protein [Bradyrhizobium sp. 76]
MDPFTIALVASAGVNAIGKLMGGASSSAMDALQGKAYDNKASLDGVNAEIAGMGVDFAASKEKTELGKIAEMGRSTLAAQRSYFAGGNLDPSFGSPLLVQGQTAGRIQTDMNIAAASFDIDKANALTSKASYQAQGASDMLSATMARYKGDADMTAGIIGAGSALLSGVSAMGGGAGGGSGGALGTIQVGQQSFPAYR